MSLSPRLRKSLRSLIAIPDTQDYPVRLCNRGELEHFGAGRTASLGRKRPGEQRQTYRDGSLPTALFFECFYFGEVFDKPRFIEQEQPNRALQLNPINVIDSAFLADQVQ
jgi:hypothetical protein